MSYAASCGRKLSRKQIVGIVVGAVGLLLVITSVAGASNKKKNQ